MKICNDPLGYFHYSRAFQHLELSSTDPFPGCSFGFCASICILDLLEFKLMTSARTPKIWPPSSILIVRHLRKGHYRLVA